MPVDNAAEWFLGWAALRYLQLDYTQRSGHHPQQDEEGTVQRVPAANHRPLHHAGDGQLLARRMPHLLRLPYTPLTHLLFQGQKAILQSGLR
ncbi:uncharacterized protein TNCV_3831481 [Trichonephila clavipes]|nr:uncharacterized protein TNCV_3831481 [Trichonephila clavipes]